MAFSSAPQVEMQTSIGTIVVELYVKHAPKTCKNFRQHALSMQCHRIIKDFMIQAGDPTGRLLVLHTVKASTLLHDKVCT